MTTASYMQAAAEIAALAGANAMQYFRKSLVTDTKADGSPVTVADRSSEQMARDWIAKRFPADGILGEEFGVLRPQSRRRWIIDPIDGTKSFVRGVPFWGTLVAVVEGEVPIAGAASYPALDETLAGARGEGAWWNDQPCSVSTVGDLSDAVVLATDAAFTGYPDKWKRWLELASQSRMSRTWGDCVGYLLVATGRAEVMVDPVVSSWDVAALIPAIAEAGGVFTDWSGDDKCGSSAIASNSKLARTVRDILNPGTDRPTP